MEQYSEIKRNGIMIRVPMWTSLKNVKVKEASYKQSDILSFHGYEMSRLCKPLEANWGKMESDC